MDKIKIIFDCDTGHDDAIAIMLASKHPDIELLGITTVNGNAQADKTVINTLNVCQHLDINAPVFKGCELPIVRDQFNALDVHGESGLDGPVFGPLTRKAEDKHAVMYLIDTIMASDGDITIVPVGPLTNIAMAMRLEPAICKKIKQISLMGGAYGVGNSTPAAEFNVYADPEAAYIVFSSGVPIVMMGLDITNTALADMGIIERMEGIGNKAGKLFGDIMRFTFSSQQKVNNLAAGPVHDVLAVAYLVSPDLFTMKEMNVRVDISHGISYGRTVADFNRNTGLEPNALVGMSLQLEKFWDLVEKILRMHV